MIYKEMKNLPDTTLQKTQRQQAKDPAALRLILRDVVEAVGGTGGMVAVWSKVERCFLPSASYGLSEDELMQLQPLLNEAAKGSGDDTDTSNGNNGHYTNETSQNPIVTLPLKTGQETIGRIYVIRPVNVMVDSNKAQPTVPSFSQGIADGVQNAMLAYLLAEERQRVEAILEGSGEGILSLDTKSRIVRFNSAMERLTGYSRDEVLGKSCSAVLGFCDWEGNSLCSTQCPMLGKAKGTDSLVELEGSIQTKDGQRIDVSMAYSLVESPGGRPLSAVVNVRDITRDRELETQRSAFLSMLGHELQSPLAIIKSYTNMLSNQGNNCDTVRQSLQVIEEECDRLSCVMKRLLLASRIESGALTLKQEPIRLDSIVNKVVRRFKGVSNIHTLVVNLTPDLPAALGDPDQIEDVFNNLIDNAIKYSPEGGRITATGRATSDYIEMSISDEGLGIPLREVDRVFERFHRVDGKATRKVRGVGLGLYLCKFIVEAHLGTISLSSELGKGSCFTVSLPIAEENEEAF
ncbi:MAG: ATP-binding protein [Chloroflexota bacterium]|nr:ATP-binding protein [Chloroflexota bacterium]